LALRARSAAPRPGVTVDRSTRAGEMASSTRAGENLDHAMTQLFDYLDDLPSAAHPGWSLLAIRDFLLAGSAREDRRAIHSLRTARARRTLLVLPDTESLGVRGRRRGQPRRTLHGDTSRRRAREWVRPTRVREWLTDTFLSLADNTNVWTRTRSASTSPQHQPGRLDLGPRLAYLFNYSTRHRTATTNSMRPRCIHLHQWRPVFDHVSIPSCDEAVPMPTRCVQLRLVRNQSAIFGSMFRSDDPGRATALALTTRLRRTSSRRFAAVRDGLDAELVAIPDTRSLRPRCAQRLHDNSHH